MATSNVLALVRQEYKQGNLESAGRRLAEFIRGKFSLPVDRVEIRRDGYSLNSVNGFVVLQTGAGSAESRRLFFKFHHEEGEGDTIKEYYRGQLLQQHGFPVDMPIHASTEVGEQLLIYAERKCPRLADRCLELELAGCPAGDIEPVIEAQRDLDRRLLEQYRKSLHTASNADLLAEPVLQLFFWRLVDTEAGGGVLPGLGGRWKRFYPGQLWQFPGLDQPLPYEQLADKQWVINGVHYPKTLSQLFVEAHRAMDPRPVTQYPAVVAHGDAHNANVWLSPVTGEKGRGDRHELVLFDPAFAGPHVPAVLAEIKSTFHNIFAHQQWLYQPRMADGWLDIRASVDGGVLRVTHNWSLNSLRKGFLDSKAELFWRPWLVHLRDAGLLPADWRNYVRMALFCCPTLVMNLRAGGDTHTAKTSLLGLSIAVQVGAEPAAGSRDVVSDFLDAIAP